MTAQPQEFVEVPAASLPADFESARKAVYSETSKDSSVRAQRLTDLAVSSLVSNSHAEPTSLYDTVLDKLTSSDTLDSEVVSYASSRAQSVLSLAKPERRYKVVLTPAGQVSDMMLIAPIKEDLHRTAMAHQMADHVGWGPKPNASYFRVNPKNIPPKMAA